MLFTSNNTTRISWIIFTVIAIHIAQVVSAYTDVPPPPNRPERFHSREELKRYLQLVHEYYAIIGRPRFGRSLSSKHIDAQDRQLFDFFDVNGDNSIAPDEFRQRLENI
ncbi:unnamed protein product [Adineta ricciae]|uniref:EF-hand domain-containing protein n=1 Tax=Adineta ricciae TaxID=249248 RepID=A0A814KMU3_ADIRI|nr:unnamed protein product [Adineta ricciae]